MTMKTKQTMVSGLLYIRMREAHQRAQNKLQTEAIFREQQFDRHRQVKPDTIPVAKEFLHVATWNPNPNGILKSTRLLTGMTCNVYEIEPTNGQGPSKTMNRAELQARPQSTQLTPKRNRVPAPRSHDETSDDSSDENEDIEIKTEVLFDELESSNSFFSEKPRNPWNV